MQKESARPSFPGQGGTGVGVIDWQASQGNGVKVRELCSRCRA
jgi:hypothetical protein